MQDLAQWLEQLSMSEYAQRFAENAIDASVLRYNPENRDFPCLSLPQAPLS